MFYEFKLVRVKSKRPKTMIRVNFFIFFISKNEPNHLHTKCFYKEKKIDSVKLRGITS